MRSTNLVRWVAIRVDYLTARTGILLVVELTVVLEHTVAVPADTVVVRFDNTAVGIAVVVSGSSPHVLDYYPLVRLGTSVVTSVRRFAGGCNTPVVVLLHTVAVQAGIAAVVV